MPYNFTTTTGNKIEITDNARIEEINAYRLVGYSLVNGSVTIGDKQLNNGKIRPDIFSEQFNVGAEVCLVASDREFINISNKRQAGVLLNELLNLKELGYTDRQILNIYYKLYEAKKIQGSTDLTADFLRVFAKILKNKKQKSANYYGKNSLIIMDASNHYVDRCVLRDLYKQEAKGCFKLDPVIIVPAVKGGDIILLSSSGAPTYGKINKQLFAGNTKNVLGDAEIMRLLETDFCK